MGSIRTTDQGENGFGLDVFLENAAKSPQKLSHMRSQSEVVNVLHKLFIKLFWSITLKIEKNVHGLICVDNIIYFASNIENIVQKYHKWI